MKQNKNKGPSVKFGVQCFTGRKTSQLPMSKGGKNRELKKGKEMKQKETQRAPSVKFSVQCFTGRKTSQLPMSKGGKNRELKKGNEMKKPWFRRIWLRVPAETLKISDFVKNTARRNQFQRFSAKNNPGTAPIQASDGLAYLFPQTACPRGSLDSRSDCAGDPDAK